VCEPLWGGLYARQTASIRLNVPWSVESKRAARQGARLRHGHCRHKARPTVVVDVVRKMNVPTFAEALRFWLKLGFISFGGPAGQIAVMHTELVDRKKWISEDRFLHALNFCMLLPGPEATQLAIYCGWLLHRTWGGIVAGALFVLPGAAVLWLLSYVYVAHGQLAWVAAIFYGLKPAVTAIVAAAVIRIGRRSLKSSAMWAIAGAAFVSIYFLHFPFPAIVLAAGILGLLLPRIANRSTEGGSASAAARLSVRTPQPADHEGRDGASGTTSLNHALARMAKVTAVCVGLWFGPVLTAGYAFGWNSVFVREGIFFSKAAMVTFGGAYAVLPYVAQHAVEQQAWLTAPQMLDGLGLAETTPGPLIMVVQFVGFLGGWNQPGTLSPLTAASLAAAMTTWTTFVPCFLWIFLGAPYIEQLRSYRRINSALAIVTAAVVGVVLNLAVWFAQQVLFPVRENGWSIDWFAVAVSGVAFVAMQRFKAGIVSIVLASGAIGLLWRLVV
jgi:chromate transporter